jgi:hypothetical protein
MRFKRLLIGAVAVLAVTSSAAAGDLASRDLVIPIVVRSPGVLGTLWQTDLVIANASRFEIQQPVTVTFHRADGQSQSFALTFHPRETLILQDVVRNRFGQETGSGIVRITTTSPAARVSARARIYNRGNAQGEYGQNVPAIPVDALTKDHFLNGLSGVDGNRTNVGVTNPWSIPAAVSISLYQSSGDSRGAFTVEVPPHAVLQLNDIFRHFDREPLDGATVQVQSAFGVYPWASVVRNDTGDAIFVLPTGVATGNERLLATQCANPVPVMMPGPERNQTDGWIVFLRNDMDAASTAAMLAARHGFTVDSVYDTAFRGFAARFNQETLAALRCESSVTAIAENVVVPLE